MFLNKIKTEVLNITKYTQKKENYSDLLLQNRKRFSEERKKESFAENQLLRKSVQDHIKMKKFLCKLILNWFTVLKITSTQSGVFFSDL